MPRLRRWLFWAHLFSGAVAGLFILFFAITGSLLAYERPILAHADDSYKVHPGPARLSISELLHRAPFQATAVTVLARPDAPILFTSGRRDLWMVDPQTGDVLGSPSPRLRRFFSTVTSLHRWFGLEANHRQAAAAVKGLAVLVFLF
ncbi:MAG TPA: PepSY-associated TM helix domain-containing protein, partial [Edaphobacter sp.]|nr:PepSY-associated TM helix domain-containing protein [Edaphobacter sp.]